MTGVLASVVSPAEAQIALAAGAEIIDLKDPAAGALGALAPRTIAAIVEHMQDPSPDGRGKGEGLGAGPRPGESTAPATGVLPPSSTGRALSATVGDLPMIPATLAAAVARTAALGVDIVKVGVFPGGDLDACLAALGAEAAKGTSIVAVMFADRQPDFATIERARASGLAGVMLDTADKRGGGLRQHLPFERLAEFVERARAARLVTGLAGSLRLEDVPALLPLRPDYLGFRGALCRDGRTGALEADRVRAVCAAVRGAAAVSAATAAAGAQRAAHSRTFRDPLTRLAKST
jgi:uncharacterized protein (UPF0264 family)